MVCNSLWTDEENALIDQYLREEIERDVLIAALSHRSAKSIRKHLSRRARKMDKPRREYCRQNLATALEPDDPGITDDWLRQHKDQAAIGSAMLLKRIMKKHPQMCGMC